MLLTFFKFFLETIPKGNIANLKVIGLTTPNLKDIISFVGLVIARLQQQVMCARR